MSLIKPKLVKESILNHLKNGPVLILSLIEKIQEDRPKTTKQAVYAALRSLKDEELVLTLKGTASLNVTWINQMTSYFDQAKKNYTQKSSPGYFLELEDTERIKYYFNDVHKADVFWTHAYHLLLETLRPNEPVFLYNPHEWFLLARTENEESVIENTTQRGHPFLVTAGGATFLDKSVRKYFDGTMSQYHALKVPLFPENNYYINIFGDFLIEAWLDKGIAQRVEILYQTADSWDESIAEKFSDVLDANGRMRIVISRNRKKAERLKKSLRKSFALPAR